MGDEPPGNRPNGGTLREDRVRYAGATRVAARTVIGTLPFCCM